jgi:SAM-dependent methyltransferase
MTHDDATGWFERLYAQAREGAAVVPWDRGAPSLLLAEWTRARGLEGLARRALIVGSGLGDNAEHIAGLGFDTLAFDIAPTAIDTARERFPRSQVEYVVADLLEPPAEWDRAFELVVECINVQSLPERLHGQAIANIARTVAPGGTLLVIAAARDEDEAVDGPPWPLTRGEIEAFADEGLRALRVEELALPDDPEERRWRAEFERPR